MAIKIEELNAVKAELMQRIEELMQRVNALERRIEACSRGAASQESERVKADSIVRDLNARPLFQREALTAYRDEIGGFVVVRVRGFASDQTPRAKSIQDQIKQIVINGRKTFASCLFYRTRPPD